MRGGYRRGCSYRGIGIIQLGYIVGAEASTCKGVFRFESVYLRWLPLGRSRIIDASGFGNILSSSSKMFFYLGSGGRGREGGGPGQGGSCEGR